MTDTRLIELTADIVSAHLSNNNVATAEVPTLIQTVFAALTEAETPAIADVAKAEPAVAIRSSVKHDYLVCLEDGKKLKMLKRYLRTNYHMTPEEYRTKWGLPRDYPMVAPAYAETRRGLAKKIGLGRKKIEATVAPIAKAAKATAKAAVAVLESAVATESPKRGRPAKAAPPTPEPTEA